jgi:hypothetical protein
MSNEKQTLVESLKDFFKQYDLAHRNLDYYEFKIPMHIFDKKFEQAKEMEKEKIIKIITKYHNSLFYTPLKNGEAEKIYNLIDKCDL